MPLYLPGFVGELLSLAPCLRTEHCLLKFWLARHHRETLGTGAGISALRGGSAYLRDELGVCVGRLSQRQLPTAS